MFYSNLILTSVGFKAPIYTIIIGVLNVAGSLTVVWLGDKFGRWLFLIVGIGLIAISHLLVFVGDLTKTAILIPIGFYLFIFSFANSLGGSFYVYLVDIVPSLGVSLASVIQWIIALIIAYFSNILYTKIGIANMYIFLFSMATAGFVLFWGFSIETSGLTDEEIQNRFMKKRFFR